uniref:Metalloendopeptidase n=1 Tax=Parascaris univalens TaxID=6257 RepID=A0A915A9M7_PARUN
MAIGIAAVIVPITLTLITKADFDVQSDDAANDYAEVRVLLNEYYKLIGRKYSSSNDYNAKEVNVALQNSSFDDGTEASTNRKGGVAGELFENDILLTLPQAQRLLKEASGSMFCFFRPKSTVADKNAVVVEIRNSNGCSRLNFKV